MKFTTEEVDSLWKLCQVIYGDKAKYQRYLDRDFTGMINRATKIIQENE